MTIDISIPQWLRAAASWVDSKLNPPASELTYDQKLTLLHAHQAKIEQEAMFIQRQINTATKLRHTYSVINMIETFKQRHGYTTQGSASCDSLHLANYNKQKTILNKL